MAKKKAAKAKSQEPITSIRLRYDLTTLPTAQHKAGLAGLLLQIRSMESRPLEFTPEKVPRIAELSALHADIELTKTSTQALFDDLYAARIRETFRSKKKTGKSAKLKRTEDVSVVDKKSGKASTKKRFVYDEVLPNAACLRQQLRDETGDGPWMKLWRDMLWMVPRAKTKTHKPWEEQAVGNPCSEAKTVWGNLQTLHRPIKLKGTLLLGAQEYTAERCQFDDRADNALLLHFWMLTVGIFVPQQVSLEKKDAGKMKHVGVALAIPDISDLQLFVEEYPLMLGEFKSDMRGYLPAEAIIDLPEQGALEFVRRLAEVAKHKSENRRRRIADSVHTFEYLHFHKPKHDAKCLASGRIAADPRLIDRYLRIVDASPRPYRNPVFRAGLIRSLLASNAAWYLAFKEPLHLWDADMFIRSKDTPKSMQSFAEDVANKFDEAAKALHRDKEGSTMIVGNEAPSGTPLEILIHRLVRSFLTRKAEAKSGISRDSFKDKKVVDETTGQERMDIPEAYRNARQKLSEDLFLSMRSRRDREFAQYFADTVCSVPQYLPKRDFQDVAKALLEKPDEVKLIAMLAVSACSR